MCAMSADPDLTTPLAPERLHWLRETLRIGSDMSETVQTLRQLGYNDRSILAAIEEVRPRGDAFEQGVMNPPLLQRAPPNLHRFGSDKVQLYTLENFLSAKECARIVALCSHHLRPSTVAYLTADTQFRTSSTADLCHLKSPVASSIDDKICRTLGIRASYSEGIQAQRYGVGQQFKAHCDFFPPDTQTYQKFAGLRGNRTWTFMVYLNEDMEGGATRFTELNHAFQPKLGMAVIWNNLLADGSPNHLTLHAGEPVTRGQKIIITTWFRRHGDGPLLYT
jgi:prolyl 4-hydroxylase